MTIDTCQIHQYTELDKDGECPTCKALGSSHCSLRELIEDELRDLWQWGYDREPREESVQPRLDAIMQFIEANIELA